MTMTFEINTDSKSVTIKSFGQTLKEINSSLKKLLGKDWEDYKLYVDNPVTYIPSYPVPYYPQPCYPNWFDGAITVNATPTLTSSETTADTFVLNSNTSQLWQNI